jgi:hypothetical protein
MLPALLDFQIRRLIIGRVAVFMVDVMHLWNRSAILVNPHHGVKVHAAISEVSAEVG